MLVLKLHAVVQVLHCTHGAVGRSQR